MITTDLFESRDICRVCGQTPCNCTHISEEKVRLDPKCWKGKKIGNPKTKMKGGVRVNNCVPAESLNEFAPGGDEGNSPYAYAIALKEMARLYAEGAFDYDVAPGSKEQNESDAEDISQVADAFMNQGMEAGREAYNMVDTGVRDEMDSYLKDQGFNVQNDIHAEYQRDVERYRNSPQGQAQARAQSAKDAEYAKGAPARKANEVVISAIDAKTGEEEFSKISFDRGSVSPEQLRAKIQRSVAELKQHFIDYPGGNPSERIIKVTIGGKPVDINQGIAENYDNGEYSDEAGMAHGNLITIAKAARGLLDTIDQHEDLPEWVQEKIAKVEGMLVSAWNYLQSQEAQGIDPRITEVYGTLAEAWSDVRQRMELVEEFDIIERVVEGLAHHNGVDQEVIWEDLESLTDDELYVFAVTTPIMEDWQKVNKKDKTDGMSRKAVKAYRREHPGSKLKTAVTTKPSKLKKGSKASKRRKSYCSRSRGQMKMHHISCAKTPDKAICKARRRWNCESMEHSGTMVAEVDMTRRGFLRGLGAAIGAAAAGNALAGANDPGFIRKVQDAHYDMVDKNPRYAKEHAALQLPFARGISGNAAEMNKRWAEKTAELLQKYGVAINEAAGPADQLSVQQLATISDEALDRAYHYGRSTPGNTFGWQANLKSAAFAKRMIDAGVTDIEAIADAIHKGWNTTAQAFVSNPEQFDDTEKLRQAGKLEAKLQQRAQLIKQNYAQLPEEEKEKDRVVARALLQALRGEQGVAEGADDNILDEAAPWVDKLGLGNFFRKIQNVDANSQNEIRILSGLNHSMQLYFKTILALNAQAGPAASLFWPLLGKQALLFAGGAAAYTIGKILATKLGRALFGSTEEALAWAQAHLAAGKNKESKFEFDGKQYPVTVVDPASIANLEQQIAQLEGIVANKQNRAAKAEYQKSLRQPKKVYQGVTEMDTQPPKGRIKSDGTRSHSTYGSRDHYSDADPQHVAKPTKAEKMMKHAHDVMMKSMSTADKVKKGWRNPNIDEGSEEQVYKVVALDKGNALKKPTKLNVKASSIEDVFSRLAANDWYALSINGVEVVGGNRLKQSVAEGMDDTVAFEIDSENAYNHVMKRFGSVIDWDGDAMVVPRRYWPAVQEVAHDAGGAATEYGTEGMAEGFPHDVDHMPGPRIKNPQTGCKRCHGKGYVYKTADGKVLPSNEQGAKRYKCGACGGIGFVKQGVAEVSDETLTSYLSKVHADSQKHEKDPTKRSPAKRNRSVQGFSRAFNKLDARREKTDEQEKRGRGRPPAGAPDLEPVKAGRVEKTATGIRHHADPSRYGGTIPEPEDDRLMSRSQISKLGKITEPIDEISKQKLGDYLHAAHRDVVDRATSSSFQSGQAGDKYNRAEVSPKERQRQAGMTRAVSRLTKENSMADELARMAMTRNPNALVRKDGEVLQSSPPSPKPAGTTAPRPQPAFDPEAEYSDDYSAWSRRTHGVKEGTSMAEAWARRYPNINADIAECKSSGDGERLQRLMSIKDIIDSDLREQSGLGFGE